MNKLFVSIILSLSFVSLWSQEIKVKEMEYLTADLSARTQQRLDLNDTPCALVKVQIAAVKDISFTGWVMGDVSYHPGEYWVYVPEGTKKIKFQHENFVPGEIVFTMPIKQSCTYRVLLDVPMLSQSSSECAALLAEGSKQYSQHEYAKAKTAYESALEAKDIAESMRTTIMADIAQCDTCLKYERYAMGSLAKMKQLRDGGNASQEEVVKYASAALEFLHVLNKFNPCEFYSSRIVKLDNMVQTMPLDMKFTLVKWQKDFAGFSEDGTLPNVEVWAYYGDKPLTPAEYETEKKFKVMTKENAQFDLVSTTDETGETTLHLDRTKLPTAFLFRAIDYEKARIRYVNMTNVLNDSEGTYHKRQFRVRMNIEK